MSLPDKFPQRPVLLTHSREFSSEINGLGSVEGGGDEAESVVSVL